MEDGSILPDSRKQDYSRTSPVVQAMPPERRETVLKRFDEIVTRLRSSGLLARFDSVEYDPDNPDTFAQDYFKLQMPCPFLKEESCSIHKDRPLACREYNVTTPADW